MSYNTSTGVVSAPVTMSDVKNALDVPIVQNLDLKGLCRSSKMNIWAKYRPFLANTEYPTNSTYYMGLTNGSSANGPDQNDRFFYRITDTFGNTKNGAVNLNFFGTDGTNDTDYDLYRYNEGSALGYALGTGTTNAKGKFVSTPVYWKNGQNNAVEWGFAKIDNTPCALYDIFDPKIYRLTDFNGYCSKAKPLEIFYCSESVVNNRFRIIIDSQNATSGIKKYCLSASWFFNNDNSYNPCFGKYLGILFLKQDATGADDYAFLINTRIYLINENGTLGFFNTKNNDSSHFAVKMENGNNLLCTSYLARNGDGYYTTGNYPQNNPWWVVTKSNHHWEIEISINDFPEDIMQTLTFYSPIHGVFFDTRERYTVQLVSTDGFMGYSNGQGHGFFIGTFSETDAINGKYSTNIDSLNIKNKCYTITNLEYNNIGNSTPAEFGFYPKDADGNIYSITPPTPPPVYVKPTFSLTYGSATNISQYYFKLKKITDSSLISQLGGSTNYFTYYEIICNSSMYGVDNEPYFNTTITVSNYSSNIQPGMTQKSADVFFELYMRKDENYSTTPDSSIAIYDGGNRFVELKTELEKYSHAYFDFAYTPEVKINDTVMNGATSKTINVNVLKSNVSSWSYGYVRIYNTSIPTLRYKMNVYYKYSNGASIVTYLLFET